MTGLASFYFLTTTIAFLLQYCDCIPACNEKKDPFYVGSCLVRLCFVVYSRTMTTVMMIDEDLFVFGTQYDRRTQQVPYYVHLRPPKITPTLSVP